MRLFVIFLMFIFLLCQRTAYADCVNPPGATAQLMYNLTHHLFQGCRADGKWVALSGNVLPTCPPGSFLTSTGDGWGCAQEHQAPEQDNTPDHFSFTNLTEQASNTEISSSSIIIGGIGPNPVIVSITGDGNPQIQIANGLWGTSGNIENGQSLRVRLMSASAHNTTHTATITVGTVSVQWSVTTADIDPCETGTPGTSCNNGSFYVGLLSGGIRIYAAPSDEATTRRWKTTSGYTSGTDSMVNGYTNTYPAQNNTTHPAGHACATKSPAGTWYLPAKNELAMIWTNRNAIGLSSKGFNTSGTYYWSSTEDDHNDAWTQRFSDGDSDRDTKTETYRVRCMRR